MKKFGECKTIAECNEFMAATAIRNAERLEVMARITERPESAEFYRNSAERERAYAKQILEHNNA